MKGLGKVAQDRVLRACKVTKEKGRARESALGRKEIDRSMEFGLASQERSFTRCKRIAETPHLMPGWGCCRCRVYNGLERRSCKNCGHVPCYPTSEGGS